MKPIVAITKSELAREAKELTRLLENKTVLKVYRHRSDEICIEFTDSTRLFVDKRDVGIELSVT